MGKEKLSRVLRAYQGRNVTDYIKCEEDHNFGIIRLLS